MEKSKKEMNGKAVSVQTELLSLPRFEAPPESNSLLERNPEIWFFLNLLMSAVGKTNDHLERLHCDLGIVIEKLEQINSSSQAAIYRLGDLPGFEQLHEDLKAVMVNQEAMIYAIGNRPGRD